MIWVLIAVIYIIALLTIFFFIYCLGSINKDIEEEKEIKELNKKENTKKEENKDV